jgi:hypothetical protein
MEVRIRFHIPDAAEFPEEEARFALGLMDQDLAGSLAPGYRGKLRDVMGTPIGSWEVTEDD